MPGARSPKLTVKQQLFIEAYLGVSRGNATDAARRAGYKGNDKTLGVVGLENLAKPYIAAAVAERLKTAKDCMGADEVLERLSEQARFSIDDFLKGMSVDFDKARALGKIHLVKSVKPTANGLAIEFMDPQAALFKLGQYHKLFTEKHELSGPNGGPIPAQIVRMPAKESPDEWSKRNK